MAELNDGEKAAKKRKGGDDVELQELEDAKENKKLETAEKLISFRVTDKPLLEGEAYEELKKKLRERKKALTCNPIFRLKSVSEIGEISGTYKTLI